MWGKNGVALNPWMEVTDAIGRKLDAEVIAADGNTTTLQVRGLVPGQSYFVRAFSDTQAVGGTTSRRTCGGGRVGAGAPSGTLSSTATVTKTFELTQTGQVHLVLTGIGASGAVEAVVRDSAGREVGRFAANAGRGRSLDLFLRGDVHRDRAVGERVADRLRAGRAVTDPVGATPEDPTNAPSRPRLRPRRSSRSTSRRRR